MQAKKIARNASASFITQIVNIIINFLLPPLIIATYGSKVNGLVSSIHQLMLYVSLVGAGISIAATQSLYKPLAENAHQKISGIFNATASMFFKAGILFSIGALVLALIYPLFINDNVNYYSVVMLIIVMSIRGASEFFVVGKYTTLLFADRKAYITSYVQAIGLILSFILAYLLIKNNANIVLVQLGLSFVFVVRIVLLSMYVNKNYEYLDRKVPPIQSAVKKRRDAFLHQITGLITLSSQTIILSTFVGLEIASVYAVYNVVFSGLQSISSQTINAVAPFLGRIYALKKADKLIIDFNKVEFIFNMILSFIYSVAAVMIIPFISVYVGGKSDIDYIDYSVAALFLLFSLFNTSRLPAQVMINVAGHFKETRNRAIIEASIALVLQLILVSFWGIYGVLLGTVVALGWRCFDIIVYSNKYIIKQKNMKSLIRVLKIPLISLMLIGIDVTFLNFNVDGYFEWVLYAIVCSVISITLILLVNLIMEKKQLINSFKYIRAILYSENRKVSN